MPANALPGYYTTKEAAEKLGYASGKSVTNLCLSGSISGAIKVGRQWLIPALWVEQQETEPVSGKGERGKIRK